MWFHDMVGCSEKDWIRKKCPLSSDRLKQEMGTFATKSIQELQTMVDTQPYHGHKYLIIRTRNAGHVRPELFDTSALQSTARTGTMFQVASNFNCQEVASEATRVDSGEYIHNLVRDRTQGPSAAGGAVAGALLRLHCYLADTSSTDLLIDVPELVHTNGKLDWRRVPHKLPAQIDDFRVGLHVNITPTFDRSGPDLKRIPDPRPVIDQVFVSTCRQTAPRSSALAALCLQAAYEGTYLCAALQQSPVLVLTAIGGGAFCNAPRQIADAILNAHRKIGPYLAPGCQVIFPVYEPNAEICRWFINKPMVRFEDV